MADCKLHRTGEAPQAHCNAFFKEHMLKIISTHVQCYWDSCVTEQCYSVGKLRRRDNQVSHLLHLLYSHQVAMLAW